MKRGADGFDPGFRRTAEELAARIGFDANADAVTVPVQMLTENRDEVVKLLKSALTNPRFDQDAIDRVKGQIQSIIHSYAASLDDIARETMDAALYGDHPHGSSDLGTAESAALTRDDLLAARPL
ncbi:MAG: insulinase family protein [Paracoccaceae bacterium]